MIGITEAKVVRNTINYLLNNDDVGDWFSSSTGDGTEFLIQRIENGNYRLTINGYDYGKVVFEFESAEDIEIEEYLLGAYYEWRMDITVHSGNGLYQYVSIPLEDDGR